MDAAGCYERIRRELPSVYAALTVDGELRRERVLAYLRMLGVEHATSMSEACSIIYAYHRTMQDEMHESRLFYGTGAFGSVKRSFSGLVRSRRYTTRPRAQRSPNLAGKKRRRK